MNYMMNGMSSEESDEKKLFFCTQFFFWGKFIHDTPYEFIKRNAKKLGRANDFFDNPQFIKVFNK